jgi:hypothetical protein
VSPTDLNVRAAAKMAETGHNSNRYVRSPT